MYSDQLEEDTPKSRAEFVDRLIIRKLLLLEAKRQGLDQQKNFLNSIKNFWEQTLLNTVVNGKISEIAARIQVTEEDVDQAYREWTQANPRDTRPLSELRPILRRKVVQRKQNQTFEKWVEGLRRVARIEINRKAARLE